MPVPNRAVDYVIWQNRAARFYVAARSCYLNHLFAPAAFCGFLALELMLKATLIYHDPRFTPKSLGHSVAKLVRMLHNRIPAAKDIQVPDAFVFEQRIAAGLLQGGELQGRVLILGANARVAVLHVTLWDRDAGLARPYFCRLWLSSRNLPFARRTTTPLTRPFGVLKLTPWPTREVHAQQRAAELR